MVHDNHQHFHDVQQLIHVLQLEQQYEQHQHQLKMEY
jgi:hypothetical protein